ncbi:MAG TPA: metalloregulator ArsR/SmtB family transcription factor [Ktedonobacteraceae bacterium]|nr:metalloregulator ArsR/SmtB family transcription factor [Ktedonobacteraceae bacterium]
MMVNNIDDTLNALADPTRRHVVELLRERPRRAGELAAATSMSSPAMSRHLRILRASGLIEVEAESADSDARLRVYRLRPEPFLALQFWLDQMQAFWADQLGAFKAHIERMERGEAHESS